MVGKRQQTFSNGSAYADGDDGDKNVFKNRGNARPRPKVFRFREATDTVLEDRRREQLKERLLNGVQKESWEKFRLSKEEVRLSDADLHEETC
jgi:hypothetical protein